MSSKYNPAEIEKKWQEKWEKEKIYSPDVTSAKKPYFNLMMFPYPSAEGMHVGNMYAFTGSDIYGRFMRMKGYDVFEPMGLDGFGIHSENYAIKTGTHPKVQAKRSEENFYRQLHAIGNGFDWTKKLETYDPDYYRWTQWIFIQLFKKGLAYRKKAAVNFCPKDKTVLADEQVIDGACERCGSVVEKRELEQWFFKITDYADRLLNNLKDLDWTAKVKLAQEQWIGRSEGALVRFRIQDSRFKNEDVEVFTTALDTIYGATFLVLSPEHPISASVEDPEVKKYIMASKQKSEQERTAEGKEKTGVFSGLHAINPFTDEEIPVWIADYVLMGYGTGAIMAVPAHDRRDHEFAKKYNLGIKPVVKPSSDEKAAHIEEDGFWDYPEIKTQFADKSILFDSGEFDGLSSKEAKKRMIEFIQEKGFGQRKVQYHLRDWLISRQRYWGPPIPMIYCEKCEWQPVPEDQLPVLLLDVEDWRPEGTGTSPLANHPEFYKTKCPKCGGEARRETDVSDTFLDSAWYFLRYPSVGIKNPKHEARNSKQNQKSNDQNDFGFRNSDFGFPWDPEVTRRWLPVNMYIGGAEHSVLHLLYSRFITMVFSDMGLLDFEEPFTTFRAHGLLIKEGAKMSKSKGNVVIPDEYIKKFGADTLRSYLLFTGPYTQGGDFQDAGIEGMHRFLNRVWRLVEESAKVKAQSEKVDQELDRERHKTIKQVTEDIANLRYNTAIAHLMEYYNELSSHKDQLSVKNLETLVLLIAPFAPHLAEELYELINADLKTDQRGSAGNQWKSVHLQSWPEYDEKMIASDTAMVVVQINGKMRDTIEVQSAKVQVQKEVEELARSSEKVKRHLEGVQVKKVIYVPGKILNFVVE